MEDKNKTKEQLILELAAMRQRVAELDKIEHERKQAEATARRSEEEARRLARENEVIAEIGRIISSSLNIGEIYERFAEEVKKIISFDRIVINSINPEDNTATPAYVSGINLPRREKGDTFPLAGTVTEEVRRIRSSLLIQAKDPKEIREALERYPSLKFNFQSGIRSMISRPLFSKDEVIGVLHLRSTKPNAYSEKDVRIVERVGNQIAGAIANAQLFAERKRAEEAREKLVGELQKTLSEIKTLKGIFPICASCKKIRDDKGYWNQVESYIQDHSEAEFTHGICPECMKKLYPEFYKGNK